MSLVIVRHAESLWNVKDLFTGWLDIDLTEDGIKSAKELSILLKEENYSFDYIFTSDLIRTINTAEFICRDNLKDVIHSSYLRERDYGNLTGMNKKSAEELLGSELFFKIRRGFYDKPKNGESLSDVSIRVGNYFDNSIKHLLEEGNNVIIVAHGNSLRGLLVHLGIFDDNTIPNFELQSCVPILVDYNNKKIEFINKYYLEGLQILDSRGYPTIQVICKDKLTGKIIGKGSSPSGASCGSTEALELRDGNKNQYMGKSVFKAIDNLQLVNRFIPLNDTTITNLKIIDNYLKKLDSSELKSKLGGNTTTAISFCIADVASKLKNIEMYQYISQLYNDNKTSVHITPFVNIINGGKHSIKGDLKIQEFMIFPNEKYPIYKKIQIITEVYHSLKKILCEKYGEIAKSIGDEGGFCPPIDSPREAIDCIIEAIQLAGYISETDVFLALDCAASEFYDKDKKLYEIEKNLFINSDDLIDYYGKLIKDYPILKSIEDGFDEKDYEAWKKFTNLYGDKLMIVGDDLFTTNSRLITYGLEHKLANSLLLKVNQIGTISEAIEGSKLFNSKNVIVSHRSGETNHAYIIDIAKGIGARFVKIGSPCRGERVEKFNRLLEIGN
jgi:enolase